MELLYTVLFVCYASYALNRKSVVFSMSKLIEDEGLDASHAGLIVSCQNLAFAASDFLIGILSDSLNPYWLFAAGLFLSGSATMTFSYCYSVGDFCFLWILNGIAQGCGWPSCAKILRQVRFNHGLHGIFQAVNTKERASPSQFGTLFSILSASNNVACSLGPFISAFIVIHFGWRWNVFTAGLITLALCAGYIFSLKLISGTTDENTPEKTSSSDPIDDETTVSQLFRDPFILLLCVSYLIIFCARTTTTDWGQIYLIEEKHHSQYIASAFQSSVETGGFIGRLAGGYLTDWIIKMSVTDSKKDVSQRVQLRMKVAILFVIGNVAFLHLFRFSVSETSSFLWIMFVGSMMGMTYYGPISILGIVSAESVPSHLSGASLAITSLFGNIGATLSGLPFSYIATLYQWSTVFLMLEILMAGTLYALIRWRNLTLKIGKPKEK